LLELLDRLADGAVDLIHSLVQHGGERRGGIVDGVVDRPGRGQLDRLGLGAGVLDDAADVVAEPLEDVADDQPRRGACGNGDGQQRQHDEQVDGAGSDRLRRCCDVGHLDLEFLVRPLRNGPATHRQPFIEWKPVAFQPACSVTSQAPPYGLALTWNRHVPGRQLAWVIGAGKSGLDTFDNAFCQQRGLGPSNPLAAGGELGGAAGGGRRGRDPAK
jgi:hypothetical protein